MTTPPPMLDGDSVEATLQTVAAVKSYTDGRIEPVIIIRVVRDGQQMLFEYSREEAMWLCEQLYETYKLACELVATKATIQ